MSAPDFIKTKRLQSLRSEIAHESFMWILVPGFHVGAAGNLPFQVLMFVPFAHIGLRVSVGFEV